MGQVAPAQANEEGQAGGVLMIVVASLTSIASPGTPQMDALLDADYAHATNLRARYRIYVLGASS